jgi:lipopolysaccharide/colanic/teichoic acid biosynthesis glycosyltransferase
MASGWRYRVAGFAGVVALTVAAFGVATSPPVQYAATGTVPVIDRLRPHVLSHDKLLLVGSITLITVVGSLSPLFKPRPRRVLDTVYESTARLGVAAMALATIGYFDLSSRLPRATLLVTFSLLGVAVPVWFVVIRPRPVETELAFIIGDDPDRIEEISDSIDAQGVNYVSSEDPFAGERQELTDGGSVAQGEFVGGLSRLNDILVDQNPDTVYLAFDEADRAEFFGVLEACHGHGVSVKVPEENADRVLTDGTGVRKDGFVEVDIEPWDWQDRLIKRLFDICFAVVGLVVLAPVMVAIAVAIKLDDGGSILYGQKRTAELGTTFQVYKFRSMVENAEADEGATISEEDAGGVDPRITRIGRVLRRTHLDEIPQLWSILVGDMSVVGPRPERPEIDADIGEGVGEWQRRWFVNPGLTGLAQINDVTGADPERKLWYDLEYIRRQSFWVDLKIVVRQVWIVIRDIVRLMPR